MRLANEIFLDAEPQRLYELLSDVERVARCLPGATVDGREGDAYRASMRVKVGPIVTDYRGTLRFVERDERAQRAIMEARAEEASGQGGAEARIVTAVLENGTGSRVTIETDLQVRGRAAQLGRGAIEKVSRRVFSEFARNLEAELGNGRRAAEPGAAAATADREPLELVSLPDGALLRRVAVPAAAALLGVLYGYLLGRVRRR